eukprot:scaffold7625_cov277-Pinguiococcus_pyrenoidosus.AAC.5
MLDGDVDMQPSRVVVMQGIPPNHIAQDRALAIKCGAPEPVHVAHIPVHVADFIRNFFDENPISNLGVIVSRDGAGDKLTALGGNPTVGRTKGTSKLRVHQAGEFLTALLALST